MNHELFMCKQYIRTCHLSSLTEFLPVVSMVGVVSVSNDTSTTTLSIEWTLQMEWEEFSLLQWTQWPHTLHWHQVQATPTPPMLLCSTTPTTLLKQQPLVVVGHTPPRYPCCKVQPLKYTVVRHRVCVDLFH